MDQTEDHSSSMVSSLETLSTYSSPASATVPQGGFSSVIGLGISNCGLGPTFDPTPRFSAPVSYSMSPTNVPTNQLVPTSNSYDAALKPQEFSDETCFPTCPPDSSLSPISPLGSFYSSRQMSASPSYNLNMDMRSVQDAFHQIRHWAPTPCSGPTTPMDATSITTGAPAEFQQLFQPFQCRVPVETSCLPYDTSNCYPITPVEENGKGPVGLQASPTQAESYTFLNILGESGVESSSKGPKRLRTPSAETTMASEKKYACPTCGFTFTRKSNCREHEKRHDPSSRRSFRCAECPKSFGRNADLKRHTDNVRQIDPALV